MNVEDRLDRVEDKLGELLVSNARMEEKLTALIDRVDPMRDEILERCKSEVTTWGWKGITAITTAIITGISGIIVSILR